MEQAIELAEDAEEYELLQKQRANLPIFVYKDEIISALNDTQFLILVGETGSGKSTQLAQFVVDSGVRKDGIVGITQPRRVGRQFKLSN